MNDHYARGAARFEARLEELHYDARERAIALAGFYAGWYARHAVAGAPEPDAAGARAEGRDLAMRCDDAERNAEAEPAPSQTATEQVARWLEAQNERIRRFADEVIAAGNDLQLVTLMFDRLPDADLREVTHMQRLASVGETEAVDALIESAWQDVMTRSLDAQYPHRVLERREIQ